MGRDGVDQKAAEQSASGSEVVRSDVVGSQALRRIALGFLLVLVTFGAVLGRTVLEGQAALLESDQAFHRGDVHTAAVQARRAAVLYAPGAPHVRAAYARLRAIAVGSEAAADPAMARFTWRALRGALLETRHIGAPFPELLDEANRELSRLELLGLPPAADRELARRRAFRLLADVEGPRLGFSVVLVVGLAAAVAGLVLLVLRGLGAGASVGRARTFAVALVAVGTLLWTLGAYQA